MPQGQVRTVPNCAEDRDDSTGAVPGQVVVVTVQKTAFSVEVPHLQFIDMSSTFLLWRRGTSANREKTSFFHRCSSVVADVPAHAQTSGSSSDHFIDKVFKV